MKNNYNLKTETKQSTVLVKTVFIALLLSLFSLQQVKAQLTGWKYRDGINVHENAGAQKLNYQVLLTINTSALVGANKMNLKGNDIRFSKDCGGSVLLNYFIDTLTMNTPATQIWVELDTLKSSGNYLMYMWYGNAAAAAASNFNNTFPLSTQLIVPTGSVTLSGTNNYSWFEIAAGATVVVGPNSPFVINARMIRITGTLNGSGAGFIGGTPGTNGSGPGAGKVSSGNLGSFGAGGASYGGVGGQGGGASAGVGQPGATYGTLNTDSIDMGSGGGGAASGGAGGAGGGGITLIGDVIDISGIVNADGSNGVQSVLDGAGGAGSGGGIKIKGNKINFSGILSANGGNGQPGGYGSGGGGGGRIKIFHDASISNSGSMTVNGGVAGAANGEAVPQAPGMPGTTFATGTWLSKVPTYSFVPHVVLTSSAFPICQGSNATFIAATGFNPYQFYVNGTSKQNSASNTYSTTTINNNDKVRVLAGDAKGCLDTSNTITATVNPLPTITLSPATSICVGGSTPLTASGGTNYNWSPPAGLSSTTGSSVTASPTVTTTYTVLVTGGNGCQKSDTVTVTVNVCTGIQQGLSFTEIHAYPNPNHGAFTLAGNFGDSREVFISLNNMLGETVKVIENTELSGNYKKEINIADLPEGIYFLLLKTKEGSQIKKITKN
ncbi:MAG TPA: DUF2341 domain-containing protein [Bacteroidia bacterium]|jgi:hypothetical protein|nr:DUF2341 domain-containing protein [Bacteroidia bacterium]